MVGRQFHSHTILHIDSDEMRFLFRIVVAKQIHSLVLVCLVVGKVETALSFQYLAHLAQAPHRMLCSLNFKACESEQYDEEGLSWYAASQLAALDWLETQEGASKMAIGVGTAVVVLHVLSMMEFLMNHMLMIAVVGFVSWYGMRNTTKPVAVAAAAK
uniref:Uncharacterized protein n=1 Tax=Cyclophora tenuis TaxID=216820 RepID=A0A7S1GJZ5_CYCTE|mmetsp:Transcript_16830/g.28561  ORF Transcript_16830/g.28561 Transcript_16830/m.28561 type:complete len:158 (+) Transcript_16830:86-559(+)